jgi:hypothetical protein
VGPSKNENVKVQTQIQTLRGVSRGDSTKASPQRLLQRTENQINALDTASSGR